MRLRAFPPYYLPTKAAVAQLALVRSMPCLRIFAVMLGSMIAMSRAADPSSAALVRDGSTFQRAFIVEAAEPERTQWETSQALKTHPGLGPPTALSRREVSH